MNGNVASTEAGSEYSLALKKLLARKTNAKLGLDRTVELLRLTETTSLPMKTIQVVGTNGKGSTVAFIESILLKQGIKTGLFTSPHLCTARERIRIQGSMVEKAEFALAANMVLQRSVCMDDEASFFEIIFAMALWLFKRHGIEVAILEAGLGGRLDATSAVQPDVLGISMIDLDHQNILGPTIGAIAREKIGAVRPGQLVVSVQQNGEAEHAILDAQAQTGFTLVIADTCERPLGLFGQHQRANAGLALEIIKQLDISISEQSIAAGLMTVNWPGRFELLSKDGTDIVIDGAHNPSGISALVHGVKNYPDVAGRPLIVVYGSLSGPNNTVKADILFHAGLNIKQIFVHEPRNPRAVPLSELKQLLVAQGVSPDRIRYYRSWQEVLACAHQHDAVVLVCGSLYTVGDIRGSLLGIEVDSEMPNF